MTAAEKLARLLALARRIDYDPDLFTVSGPAVRGKKAEWNMGDLQDFHHLHTEVLALLDAGAELESVKREREALRRQTRSDAQYLQRCFDDLRHAEALAEERRAERDEARELARYCRRRWQLWADRDGEPCASPELYAAEELAREYAWLEQPQDDP